MLLVMKEIVLFFLTSLFYNYTFYDISKFKLMDHKGMKYFSYNISKDYFGFNSFLKNSH